MLPICMMTLNWVPQVTWRNISCYYTYFSFVLFCIGIFLPSDSLLRNAILVNSIGVGLIGNLIVIYAAKSRAPSWALEEGISAEEKIYRTTEDENNLTTNFMVHTLPLIIALVLLMRSNNMTYDDTFLIYLISFIFMLIWSVIPHRKMTGGSKMVYAYPGWSVGALLAGSSILVVISGGLVYAKKV